MGNEWQTTYPASEPPTQAIAAGANAGAFPALMLPLGALGVDGGGDGLLTMAKYGMSCFRQLYRS